MAKVITFSRQFPRYHPRVWEPTFFVEKILSGLADENDDFEIPADLPLYWNEYYNGVPKLHTIRAGHRWKVGDTFSPRYWEGKPYRSKQIQFAPNLEVKKVYDFETIKMSDTACMCFLNGLVLRPEQIGIIAKNDGFLNSVDFLRWFQGHIDGQIICWSNEVDYDKWFAETRQTKMNELLEGCKSDLNQMLDIVKKM